MTKFKGTTGEFSINKALFKNISKGYDIIYSKPHVEGVFSHISNFNMSDEEAKANAKLISDSLNTIQKCDLLPSEVLAQRNELSKALQMCVNSMKLADEVEFMEEISRAELEIKKIEK